MYDRVYSHQVIAFEALVKNVENSHVRSENFVSLYSGIESVDCEEQRMWAINTVTNAHNLRSGDEVYGIEVDTNIDGDVTGGHYVGLYIAGIGDLTGTANSDGIRVQRVRDSASKWQYGQRIFDSVVGIAFMMQLRFQLQPMEKVRSQDSTPIMMEVGHLLTMAHQIKYYGALIIMVIHIVKDCTLVMELEKTKKGLISRAECISLKAKPK